MGVSAINYGSSSPHLPLPHRNARAKDKALGPAYRPRRRGGLKGHLIDRYV